MYVDGFVVPVPKKKRAAYIKVAKTMSRIMRDHGALEYRECVADDVKPGKWTSFPLMDPKNFPFDGKRIIFGGFKVEVAK